MYNSLSNHIEMKRPYQHPLTQKVLFAGNTDTLNFTNLTDLSNAGNPGDSSVIPAPSRSKEL